jgi:large subunit ribosomal protein L15
MELHDLIPQEGSKKKRKRVGRGTAAGQGKTAGRGTKGQGARAGAKNRLYHQGGNLPFFRRLPFVRGKGFTPINRIEYNEINLKQLSEFTSKTEVNPTTLEEAHLIRNTRNPIVILAEGEINKALKVHVHRISKSARSKIEAAGGKVELLKWPSNEVN